MSTITSTEEPTALPPIFENIPDALTVWPHWVLWKYIQNDRQQWTKPPFIPTGARASTTDPTTWRPFEDVVAAYCSGGWDGVGIALVPPHSGVDLEERDS